MTPSWNGLGNELGTGLSAFAQQLISTQNTLQQQAEVKQQRDLDNQFRQQQADEERRRADRLYNFQVDTVAYDRVTQNYNSLVTNLKSGAFDKDPLLKSRATHALQQAGKLQAMIGRGERPDQTQAAEYDQMWAEFGDLAAAAGINLGTNAALRDDAQTKTLVNAATMSDYDVTYSRDTLPKRIEGFVAQQDSIILQRDILAAIAPYQTAVGKAEGLAKIAALGGTSAGVVKELINNGLIDPDTVKALQTRMGQVDTTNQATTDSAVAQAGMFGVRYKYAEPMALAELRQVDANAKLTELEVKKVTETLDGTIAALNSNNDLTVQKNAVVVGLLKLDGAAQRAEYLGGIAAQGNIGAAVIDGLLKDGLIDEPTATAAKTKAGKVVQAEDANLSILLDSAAIKSNDRETSDATFQAGIKVFNSDADLRLKANEAAAGLLSLKTAAERGAYLEKIAGLGAPGQAILDGLKDRGIITAQQAGAFKAKAGNAQRVEDATVTNTEATATVNSNAATQSTQTLDSSIKVINSNNSLTVKTNAAKEALLPLQSGAQRAEFLGQIASQGSSGIAVLNRLQAQGIITPEEAAGARKVATNVQTAQNTQTTLGTLELRKVKETLDSSIQVINSNNTLEVKTNEIKTSLLSLQGGAQRAEYLGGIAAQGEVGAAVLDNLEARKVITPQEAKGARTRALQVAKMNAAAALDADGNKVNDPAVMQKSLEQMRIINSQNIRVAQANLKGLIARYLPNAKFSVDKWDSKQYTTLMGDIKALPADVQAAITEAAAQVDMYTQESKDIQTAFAQVGSKTRIDPKVAERLGIFSPEEGAETGNFIQGPSTPPAKAPKARNVPAGVVSGKGGVVYSGGGAKAVQSLVPQGEITKQIVMTTDHYLGKIKQQGGYSNPWDNTAGPVRAYNGMGPTLDVQKRYVNDIRATYDAKPWMQAMSDATGARKVELQYINAEAERIAKQRGVDPDVIKAIMWNESMGWQPGIPSSDGKGGGLGQVTGYFPPKGSTYSLAPGNVRTVGGTTGPQKPTGTTTTTGSNPPPKPTSVAPADVPGIVSEKRTELSAFYTTVQKAPSAQAAQKLIQDQAIKLAGGPNAPQALKAAYFDALLAGIKAGSTAAAPASSKFPPLAGATLTTPAVTALSNAYKSVNAVKDPAQQRAKGAQVIQALAPQLTKILGRTVTPDQVFAWLRENGKTL